MLCTLTLCNFICKLYFNKARKKNHPQSFRAHRLSDPEVNQSQCYLGRGKVDKKLNRRVLVRAEI
jgi:hypothetical protein